MQLIVIGLPGGVDAPEILIELTRLRDKKIVGLADVLFVTKDDAGNLTTVDSGTGRSVRSLLGLGEAGDEPLRVAGLIGGSPYGAARYDGEEVWHVTEAIPPGTSAAITLIEHRWVIPLLEAVIRAGGATITDAWVHPDDIPLIDAAGPEQRSGGADRRRISL